MLLGRNEDGRSVTIAELGEGTGALEESRDRGLMNRKFYKPKRSKPLPKRRAKPRRRRPDLFFTPEPQESWDAISLRVRRKWWFEAEAKNTRPRCGICRLLIVGWGDMVPDHIKPGKMGGCKDNSESNLQPAHWWCNNEKGSKRNNWKATSVMIWKRQ